jgi:hypothetical protein
VNFIDEVSALLHQIANNRVVQDLATIGAAAVGLAVLVAIAIVALMIGIMLLGALANFSRTSDPSETISARSALAKATASAGNPHESADAQRAVAQIRQGKRTQRARLLVLVLGIPMCLLLLLAVWAPRNDRGLDEPTATSSQVAQPTGEGHLASGIQTATPTFNMQLSSRWSTWRRRQVRLLTQRLRQARARWAGAGRSERERCEEGRAISPEGRPDQSLPGAGQEEGGTDGQRAEEQYHGPRERQDDELPWSDSGLQWPRGGGRPSADRGACRGARVGIRSAPAGAVAREHAGNVWSVGARQRRLQDSEIHSGQWVSQPMGKLLDLGGTPYGSLWHCWE